MNLTKFRVPFQFKETYNPVVPLKIYQTWHTKKLPPNMFKNIIDIKNKHPRFEYFLFDDNDCREFIKNNFSEEVLWAFDKLIPGAYKADLWRYCILYKQGGIYLDIKFKCINGFRMIALTEKEYFVNDINKIGIYNGLIVSKPGNQILLNCINDIVNNVKNKFYGEGCLYPTGPMLIDKYFNDKYKRENELNMETLNISSTEKQHLIKYNNTYIFCVYNNYRDEQKIFQKKEHYGILWTNKNIYN